MDYNKEVFKGKTISKLMEEAYKDKKDKQEKLNGLINQLKEFITDGGDAIMMVPLIKEYMDLSIKNDDVLLKLLGIIQKIEAVGAKTIEDNGGVMSERDKQLLFESLDGLGIE
jgi:predicted transcriptional regulator